MHSLFLLQEINLSFLGKQDRKCDFVAATRAFLKKGIPQLCIFRIRQYEERGKRIGLHGFSKENFQLQIGDLSEKQGMVK